MVRALEDEEETYKKRLHHLREIHGTAGRHAKSLSIETSTALDFEDEDGGDGSQTPTEPDGKGLKPRLSTKEAATAAIEAKEKQQQSDMEQMRERFAKLLLGEDMSGGGKGVSSALALSNAITNLAASVFGEQTRLEPMSADRKARWRKEIDWLLSVTDYIVEFVASQQKNKDGSNMEIMVTRQRTDLLMNIPALRKLDAMLIDCLDNFRGDQEFYYVSKDADEKEKGNAKRKDDKWWLPTPKVPPDGLSEAARKFLQYQKDCVNQVLKAAMAINAQVLTEMEIPENYIESLPKNGRASLGDQIYRSITVEFFDPDQFLCAMDLSSDHKILDLKNKMEASMVIWKRKMNQKDGKSGWGSAVSLEKRELFEERAETILLLLKQRFPGIPQSSLDISKIQYNADVGQAILESYSRILESLAFTVLSRIEDVLYADYAVHNPLQAVSKRHNFIEKTTSSPTTSPDRSMLKEENGGTETPTSMTLSDFMGWGCDQGDSEAKKEQEAAAEDGEVKHPHIQKLANIVTNKKISYLETLGGMRSPTARH
ncbi:putative PRONE domain-containing protein [Rosa chinensis]|uniref:Putative PRONE domain-containing protein n=1 Tax=Rosa chinensis TaxID=74649 RepID=A0A2P6RWZ2_ROSCH|nr:rop guanine nucleotide exchange factor 12 [Rosa chinensis]PRQ50953.1 putative PRONE domain-containing protein [Rosa chinensis]